MKTLMFLERFANFVTCSMVLLKEIFTRDTSPNKDITWSATMFRLMTMSRIHPPETMGPCFPQENIAQTKLHAAVHISFTMHPR